MRRVCNVRVKVEGLGYQLASIGFPQAKRMGGRWQPHQPLSWCGLAPLPSHVDCLTPACRLLATPQFPSTLRRNIVLAQLCDVTTVNRYPPQHLRLIVIQLWTETKHSSQKNLAGNDYWDSTTQETCVALGAREGDLRDQIDSMRISGGIKAAGSCSVRATVRYVANTS